MVVRVDDRQRVAQRAPAFSRIAAVDGATWAWAPVTSVSAIPMATRRFIASLPEPYDEALRGPPDETLFVIDARFGQAA